MTGRCVAASLLLSVPQNEGPVWCKLIAYPPGPLQSPANASLLPCKTHCRLALQNKLLDALEDHRYTRTDLDAATWDDLEGTPLTAATLDSLP